MYTKIIFILTMLSCIVSFGSNSPIKSSTNICNRHVSVIDGINSALGTDSCLNVTPEMLTQITDLEVGYRNGGPKISRLRSTDFEGLTGLKSLFLATIIPDPDGAFDIGLFKELPNLESLVIYFSVNKIPTDLFLPIANLKNLIVGGVEILDSDSFRGLNQLNSLTLSGFEISHVEPGTFSMLNQLKTIDSHELNIEEGLPDDSFYNMPEIEYIIFPNCALPSVPESIFQNFPNLIKIDLRGNNDLGGKTKKRLTDFFGSKVLL